MCDNLFDSPEPPPEPATPAPPEATEPTAAELAARRRVKQSRQVDRSAFVVDPSLNTTGDTGLRIGRE